MFGGLVVVVLLLGVGLYLGQARDVNASGSLSMEDMGNVRAGLTNCCKDYDVCVSKGKCNGYTREKCLAGGVDVGGSPAQTCGGGLNCRWCRNWLGSRRCVTQYDCVFYPNHGGCFTENGESCHSNAMECSHG